MKNYIITVSARLDDGTHVVDTIWREYSEDEYATAVYDFVDICVDISSGYISYLEGYTFEQADIALVEYVDDIINNTAISKRVYAPESKYYGCPF